MKSSVTHASFVARILSVAAEMRPLVPAATMAAVLSFAGVVSSPAAAFAAEVDASSLLDGNYVFALTGESLQGADLGNNYAVMGGSLVANCNGGITAGEADRGDNMVSTPYNNLTGSYHINDRGQGTLTLKAFTAAGGTTTPVATYTFKISIVDSVSGKSHKALLTEIDNLGTLHGTLEKQNTASFKSHPDAGNYNYSFNGPVSASGVWEAVTGVATVNSSGQLASFLYDDYAQNFSVVQGTQGEAGILPATLDSFGRGTVRTFGQAFGFYQTGRNPWAYYQIDAKRFLFISTDNGGAFSVPALIDFTPQPATLPTSLAGTYVFTAGGAEPQTNNIFALAPAAIGGVFTCDANGNLTGILLDSNDQLGYVTYNTVGAEGTCTLDSPADGRGLISFNLENTPIAVPTQFTVYQTNQGLTLVTASANTQDDVYGGVAYLQHPNVAVSDFTGDYAGSILSYNQETANGVTTYNGLELLQGRFEADGVDALKGRVDVNAYANNGGSVTLDTPLTGTTGFTNSGNGRLTGGVISTDVNSTTQNVYLVDRKTALTFETDSSVGLGILELPRSH